MVQQDNFLTYIKNSKYAYYYPLFVFMLETALRVGEVCGLTWDDVDLEHWLCKYHSPVTIQQCRKRCLSISNTYS